MARKLQRASFSHESCEAARPCHASEPAFSSGDVVGAVRPDTRRLARADHGLPIGCHHVSPGALSRPLLTAAGGGYGGAGSASSCPFLPAPHSRPSATLLPSAPETEPRLPQMPLWGVHLLGPQDRPWASRLRQRSPRSAALPLPLCPSAGSALSRH